MSSRIFNALLEEKIDFLTSSFKNTARAVFYDAKAKQLTHPGEFGTYRENVVKDFLRFVLPQKLAISSGFIISPTDEISTQCDIIIYDHNITPLIQSSELQRFFPVETVVGVGEIKSRLTKADFVEAINKLAAIKAIKTRVPHPNIYYNKNRGFPFGPKLFPSDGTFTFIVCEKLDFNLDDVDNRINGMYDNGVNFWDRHNLILSMEDGMLTYQLPNNIIFYGPTNMGECKPKFIKFDAARKYHHFKTFVASVVDAMSMATVLYPEMAYYMDGFTPVANIKPGAAR